MQDFALTTVGLVLLSLPAILLVLAWKSGKRRGAFQVALRERVFTAALIGTGLTYLWFWIAFLTLPHLISFGAYEKIGWISQSFSFVFLVLSLAGTGTARRLAVLAAAGVAMLWVSLGFW